MVVHAWLLHPQKCNFWVITKVQATTEKKIFVVGSSYTCQTMRLVVYFAAHIHIVAENITNILFSSKHERPPPSTAVFGNPLFNWPKIRKKLQKKFNFGHFWPFLPVFCPFLRILPIFDHPGARMGYF